MDISLIRRLSPVLALLLAAGGAMAQTATSGTAASDAASGAATHGKSEPHKDASFMKNTAEDNLAEIEAAKTAQQKSQNDQVKALANQLIEDHTKANDELKSLAESKGVKLPTSPSMMEKAKLKMLGSHDGAKFDKEFGEWAVKSHEKDISAFQKESKDGKDADVKAWADKTLPTLQHHLDMARDLEKTTGGKKK